MSMHVHTILAISVELLPRHFALAIDAVPVKSLKANSTNHLIITILLIVNNSNRNTYLTIVITIS